jgi:hypothetical protein
MIEAVSTSETSVNFYQTTRRNNPEDNHIHARRRENLKSHYLINLRARGKYNHVFIHAYCGKKRQVLCVVHPAL